MLSRRQSTRLAILLILAGLAVHAHSIGWGFLYDDFMHQALMRYRDQFPEVCAWNLYDYGTRPEPGDSLYRAGLYPWWTAADFSVRFLRPVSSLSILSDFALYRSWAPGYHLTNLCLFGILLALVFRMARQFGAPRRAALWALAFLAFEDVLALPVGWIANRNALLASLFTTAALLALHRHRSRRCRAALALSVLFFLLACGSKESGLMTLPLMGFYLLLLEPGPPGENLLQGCVRVLRCGVLWIFAAVAGVYLVAYLAAGYGTNSQLYSTLWGAPGVYVQRLATFVPVALTGLFFGVPADMVFARPALALRILVLGAPALGLLTILFLRVLRGNRLAGFAAVWTLLALVPVAGVTTGDRLLVNACVGTSMLLGLLVDGLGGLPEALRRRRYGRLAVIAGFALVGIVLSAAMIRLRGRLFMKLAGHDREAIAHAEVDPSAANPKSVFVLSVPGAFFGLTLLPTWAVTHDDPSRAFNYMQMGRRPLALRRENRNTLMVNYGAPGLLDNRYERLFQTSPTPPAQGTVFMTAEYSATVMETSAGGVLGVRLEFNRDLDDPSYAFLAWSDGRLRKVSLPALGETLQLEAAVPAIRYAP